MAPCKPTQPFRLMGYFPTGSRANAKPGRRRNSIISPTWACCAAWTALTRILLVDGDAALRGLIEEWLADEEFTLVDERPDLVLVDLPWPRDDGASAVRRVSNAHPSAPVVALSSSFFPGIEANGALARSLGVASVLPKPLTRDALLAAVRRALG